MRRNNNLVVKVVDYLQGYFGCYNFRFGYRLLLFVGFSGIIRLGDPFRKILIRLELGIVEVVYISLLSKEKVLRGKFWKKMGC